jgi:hypothetical protein
MTQKIPWLRIGAESVAIVASILLAFAINAWWEGRQIESAETLRLARVVAELESNAGIIEEKVGTLTNALDAAYKVVSWLGPDPENVAKEDFVNTFMTMYSVGVFSLQRNALDDYLAAGQIDTVSSANLREKIVDWYSQGDDFEGQYSLFRGEHRDLSEYLVDTGPTLHIDVAEPAFSRNVESRFPFDHLGLMSDPRFESRVSIYLLRIEFLLSGGRDLLQSRSEVIAQIQSMADI